MKNCFIVIALCLFLSECQANKLIKYAEGHNPIETLLYFINIVNDEGEQDIKLQSEWAFEEGKIYIYNGIVLRYDDPRDNQMIKIGYKRYKE